MIPLVMMMFCTVIKLFVYLLPINDAVAKSRFREMQK
jgi:hypothetical protein